MAELSACRALALGGDYAGALGRLSPLAETARDGADPRALPALLHEMAWCCMRLGQAETGLTCASEARRLWARAGDSVETAHAMALESLLLLDLGLSDEAYEEIEQAVAAAQQADSDKALTFARNVKGCILAVCGQPDLAIPLIEECIARAEAAGDRANASFYRLNLGFCLSKRADAVEAASGTDELRQVLDQAIHITLQAVDLAVKAGEVWVLRSALCNGAEMLARTGGLDRARELLRNWQALPGTPGLSAEIHYLYTLGDVLTRTGDLEQAREVCARAVALAGQSGQIDHQVNTTGRLAAVEEARGDYPAALKHLRRFHKLYVRQTGETARRRSGLAAVRLKTAHWRERASTLADQAMRDALTGIANRRRFELVLDGLAGHKLAVAILDLDHFKRVNDLHSHMVGDEVLKRVARLLEDEAGPANHAARLGGEEFALIFPGADMSAAEAICTRIQAKVRGLDLADLARDLTISVSMGLAAGDGSEAPADLVQLADDRLYGAKHAGRDRLVTSDPMPGDEQSGHGRAAS